MAGHTLIFLFSQAHNLKSTQQSLRMDPILLIKMAAAVVLLSPPTKVPSEDTRFRLQDELDTLFLEFMEVSPQELIDILVDKAEKLAMAGIVERAVKVDDVAPHFTLPDAKGKQVSVSDLIMDGPLVVTFYRGEYCPYCNITLRALQKYLPKFQAKGASLVAISPQLPDYTAKMAQKHDLQFPVLSDVGCKVGMEYGVDFVVGEDIRPLYEKFGANLALYNGDKSYKLPVPATYVIDTDGTVLYSFVNTDHTKRAEPEEILAAIPDYGPKGGAW